MRAGRNRSYLRVRPIYTGQTRVPLLPLHQVDFLLGQSYDAKVTRLDRQPWGPTPGQDSQPRTGPIVTTEIPFQLEAGIPQVLCANDPARTGLMLQNLDPVENLYYAFGRIADQTSRVLEPGMVLLRDFNTPTDRITVFATANVQGALALEAPGAG